VTQTQNALSLVVSIGDPAGIGPEVIVQAWARREELNLPVFAICGGKEALIGAAKSCGIDVPIAHLPDLSQAASSFSSCLPIVGGDAPSGTQPIGAHLALASLEQGVDLVRDGSAGGIVTGPVSKSTIAAIKPDFIGQTEFCADACHVARKGAVMMLAGPSLRTVPMTVHCALADVPGMLTHDLIVGRCRIVARAMQTDFGIAAPRIAIAGLNPHAGEDGRMGREEIDIIQPAIASLRADGIDVTGPHPADTLFAAHKRTTYDVAVAMYHDQALVPLKTLDFDEGVNITLGLPIVRTSPDHGTAFDIAGKGIARPDAMIAAIRMAGEVAAQRALAHG